ncbi:hypothetical protein CHARACLAT_023382 [Characodon lateralis]|uniref:Uncharacterized protein n=1 Tax=Characodon lateralis TaxID=208331 RepID=A0ABU7DX32_9TELE|nr:hypothetical protein [Characodon lateralis]
MSSIPEKLMNTLPHSASSTHSPCLKHPHHILTTEHSDGKARAPCNAPPDSTHKRNRADTTECRTHNGTPTPHQDGTDSPKMIYLHEQTGATRWHCCLAKRMSWVRFPAGGLSGHEDYMFSRCICGFCPSTPASSHRFQKHDC